MNEEQTLFKGSSSGLINLWSYLFGWLLLAGSIAAGILFSVFALILAGIAFLYMAALWLRNRFRVYELTTERIRLQTGILTRKTEELELYRVQDITLIEPLFERIFGVGSIRVVTGDETTPELTIESIRGAARLREELRKCVETCREKKRVRVAEMEGGELH